jgi:type IV pilus assembly protein PilM
MADNSGFSIDLNEKYTRMAEVKINGTRPIEITSMGYDETTPFYYASDQQNVIEKQAEVLSRLHRNLHIKKKNARVIIPDIYTFSRVIEMPKLKEKELLAAIRYQADEFIPMAIEDTNLDLQILKEDTATNKLLIFIVASPKKVIEKIQQTVELADLVPEFLENELSAVARLISTFMKKPPGTHTGTTILINFGYATTSLYLFDESNSILLLSRSFKIGMNLFIKDIIANLSIDEGKATEALRSIGADTNASVNLNSIISPIIKEIAREIERFILISKDKYGLPVSDLYSFNYESSVGFLNKRLQESLSIPISTLSLSQQLVDNPIKQSFSATLSSFISVIAANI